ncbi:OB-fold domain-containing protein [Xanthobacter dioxanivorans]|uniref:OB-fold domain-containing protein n=1 Tax=Xanthobacter dioxanivorans TaxID=2528964 RepID=A0A974PTB0_9HYPH|nr:OB-fold domain-containing protein [Xanthobacter dioxanivorans]QRG09330.1 OB-fold domain-containing protein [Xanthobacter dioxanivorans]
MSSNASPPPAVEILRCADCGRFDPGPRELCPACHSSNMVPCAVSGDGVLVSWTLVRRPPTRFKSHGPYAVAVVDLDCGVRFTGRLAEVPQDEADAPRLGGRMRFAGGTDGIAFFAPDPGRR